MSELPDALAKAPVRRRITLRDNSGRNAGEAWIFLSGYLLVWVDVDVALDALLAHVGPGVAAHPLPLTLGALVLSEAPLLALVGRQSFAFGPGLGRNTHNNTDDVGSSRRVGVPTADACVTGIYIHPGCVRLILQFSGGG